MSTAEQYFLRAAASSLRDVFLPRIEEAVAKLSEAEIWERPAPEANSVGNLLLHLSGSLRQHAIAGLSGAKDIRTRKLEFNETGQPPKSELLANLRRTVEEACDEILKFDPALLVTIRTIQDKEVRVLDDLLHVVEHFSYHTGQIIFWVKAKKQTTFPWYDYLKDT